MLKKNREKKDALNQMGHFTFLRNSITAHKSQPAKKSREREGNSWPGNHTHWFGKGGKGSSSLSLRKQILQHLHPHSKEIKVWNLESDYLSVALFPTTQVSHPWQLSQLENPNRQKGEKKKKTQPNPNLTLPSCRCCGKVPQAPHMWLHSKT